MNISPLCVPAKAWLLKKGGRYLNFRVFIMPECCVPVKIFQTHNTQRSEKAKRRVRDV